jgi:Redoxin.
MKNSIIIIVSFSLFFVGCCKKETIITGQFTGQSEILMYSVPISEMCYLGFVDTIKLDENGYFSLNIKINQPACIHIWNKEPYKKVNLLIESGKNYHVVMDVEKGTQISGANAKGQMLYTTLPTPAIIELGLSASKITNPFNDTVSLVSGRNKINDLKQSDMSKFKTLLDNGEITKSYFDLIQKDRDCYYASLEARFLLLKTHKSVENGISIDDELIESLKKIYDQYPPEDASLHFSYYWPEYAEFYITDYKQYIQEGFNKQKFLDFRKAKMYNQNIINEAKKYFSGKSLGFFQAKQIFNTCFQGSFEKEMIFLFEQFEKDYPQSEYSKYLKPYIDKIIDYHEIIEKPLDSDILIMNNHENIKTLEEAVKPLLGKKIYIDVWGTWCNPCIREFTNNEALKKILADNDIQLLYISVGDNDDLKWKNAIKYYHLTGTHIRGNQELFIYLEKLYSKNMERSYIEVPWYILIDEKGNIMDERAKSPSQLVSGEKLF